MVYAHLLDAGLRYDEIPKRTLLQITALLGEWASLIQIKTPLNPFGGFGGIGGSLSPTPTESDRQDSQETVDSFFNSF